MQVQFKPNMGYTVRPCLQILKGSRKQTNKQIARVILCDDECVKATILAATS